MLGHMHKLKKKIDLSFLTGRKLTQVAIGLYQVEFQFDEDVTVSVEAEFRYFAGQDEWLWRQEPCSARAMKTEHSPNVLKWAARNDTGLIQGLRVVRHHAARRDHYRGLGINPPST
jgi:hypothetical protein